MATYLTRDKFREAVLALKDGDCCVPGCKNRAVDAHHIIERRLWDDGGYYLENGAPVCEEHHLAAEMTTLSPQELRDVLGHKVVLPPHMPPDDVYDKWGNIVNPDGSRSPGELFWDESVQKILAKGGVLALFRTHRKYPKTPHLPNSPGRHGDDTVIDLRALEALLAKPIIITEKMDGENTTFYTDYVHARSLDSMGHSSQDYVKRIHSEVAHEIPRGWRVVGENMYAKHSIHYDDLKSYFLVFAIFDEHDVLLSWPEVREWAELLGLATVPEISAGGIWGGCGLETDVDDLFRAWLGYVHELNDYDSLSPQRRESEGFVVRNMERVAPDAFRRNVAKYVREGHVQTIQHGWKYRNDYDVNALGKEPR